MFTKQVLTSLLIGATAATAFGCASTPTTTQTTTPAEVADRHVMATTDKSFEQFKAQLPQQISVADAERMLVTIDPSQVKDEGTRTVQQWRGRFGGFGIHRGFGRFGGIHRFGGFGLNRFRFYNYGNYYYPYSLYGGYYRPYMYSSCYNPFLYGYGSTYYPYTYGYGGCGGLGSYGWGY